MINKELLYAENHEWLRDLGDGTFEVGLSHHAQEELGDIVFINLPDVGDEAEAGATIADVESVKAVSDIYSPVDGTVCEVNEALLDTPELINEDCYGTWLFRLKDVGSRDSLMDAAAYEAFLGDEA